MVTQPSGSSQGYRPVEGDSSVTCKVARSCWGGMIPCDGGGGMELIGHECVTGGRAGSLKS